MDNIQSKCYIFLSHPIKGMGGAQVYVRDKTKFLENKGFRVLVISGNDEGEFVIKEFLPYKDYIFPQLSNKPFVYSKKKRERVISKIIGIIGAYSQVIIETTDINSGEWGELIAARIKARNILFCLAEQFSNIAPAEVDFLTFKHKRKELFGINDKTLPLLFHRDMPKEDCYFWKAVSENNPVDVYNKDIENIKRKDFNIGSIGRYDKPYVPTMLKELSAFVKTHPSHSINIVLCIGAHKKEDEDEIMRHFYGMNNVEVHIFGPLNPLPISLFNLCDVFISTAGCAGISLRMDVPTITLDAFDFKPIGVFGFTTQNNTYRQDEELKDMNELLEDILIKRLYDGLIPQKPERIVEKHYENQMNDALAIKSLEYFDINGCRLTMRIRIMKFLMLLGDGFYNFIRKLYLR